MRRKSAVDEFVKGLLERLSAEEDSGSFHTSVFEHAFDEVRARFRGWK